MDYEPRLEKLRDLYPDEESRDLVNDWGKKLKLASLTANLKGHDGMKIILDSFERELLKIRKQLWDNDLLFKSPEGILLGSILHERKKWITDFLAIFDRAEKQITGLSDLIDNKLLDEK